MELSNLNVALKANLSSSLTHLIIGLHQLELLNSCSYEFLGVEIPMLKG